ncbi:MAG TPA: DUF3971 domain-containing protein [Azospirillaceae bacterium]|nr:DUF3971 domain-containing protein [Azospirillaceae bacterium]
MIRPTIRRLALILLELTAGLLLLLVVAGGLLGWRLSQGPLRLEFLTPYVAQALNGDGQVRTDIQGTELSWAGFGAPVEVRAVGVTAFGQAGAPVATLPELRIGLSLPGLLRGRVAPVYLDLVEPAVNAVREADGTVRLDIRLPDESEDDSGNVLGELVAALKRPPDPTEPLGALRELRISRARLTVANRQLGIRWTAPRADINLRRNERGIVGQAALDVDLGGKLTRLNLDLDYSIEREQLAALARFRELRPAELAPIAPVLAELAGFDLPLSGAVWVEFDREFAPMRASLELEGGKGWITRPELPEPVDINGLALSASLGGGTLELARFRLDLGGPVLTLSGSGTRGEGGYEIALRAGLDALKLADLGRFWPEGVMPAPRAWMLENLADGAFDRVDFEMEATAPRDDIAALAPNRLDGRFAFSGATVTYFRPLPPVTGVAGSATFDGKVMDITIAEGRLLDLKLAESKLSIAGLDTPGPHRMDIRIPLSGPVSSALKVVDHKPLGYASKVGLKPETVGGTADIRLHFAFPLLADLKFEQVGIKVDADMRDVAAAGIVADIAATEGDLTLDLDNKRMKVKGTARLNGMPAEIDWDENFPDDAEIGTRVAVRATADDRDRERFRLDFPEWVRGPVGVDMVYAKNRAKRESIDAVLDLTPATVAIGLLDWEKAPDLAGLGSLRVEFVDGKPTRIPRFNVRTAELETEGRLELWPDYELKRLELDRLRLGDTDARMELDFALDGGKAVRVTGASLDARPFRGDDEEEQGPEPTPEQKAAEPPLAISFDLDRVLMGEEGQRITKANGELARRKGMWERAILDARVGEKGTLTVRYRPEGGALLLDIETDDAGAALRELDVLPHVRGGWLKASGASDPNDPDHTVAGRFILSDYQVVDAPALARLLSAASPRGFADFLSGQPISFDRAEGDYRWRPGGLSFRQVRTSGSAVGLTMEGDVNTAEDRLDLQGTIVPFSLVNRLLGALPLVGDLLVGGEGQGLFAATYRVRGSFGEPDIGVNPLAVLAPGFLRNLFFLPDPAGEEAKPDEKPPAKPSQTGKGP